MIIKPFRITRNGVVEDPTGKALSDLGKDRARATGAAGWTCKPHPARGIVH